MDAADDEGGGKDPLAEAFGARVAYLRQQRGWEIVEVAKRTGMSDKYLWRLEKGQLAPGLRNLARLAIAYDITLSDLLRGVAVPSGIESNRGYKAVRKPGRPAASSKD